MTKRNPSMIHCCSPIFCRKNFTCCFGRKILGFFPKPSSWIYWKKIDGRICSPILLAQIFEDFCMISCKRDFHKEKYLESTDQPPQIVHFHKKMTSSSKMSPSSSNHKSECFKCRTRFISPRDCMIFKRCHRITEN